MPIDNGNLALKGLDDLFSTEENRQGNSGSRYSRFPLMRCIPSPTTPSRYWTMKP